MRGMSKSYRLPNEAMAVTCTTKNCASYFVCAFDHWDIQPGSWTCPICEMYERDQHTTQLETATQQETTRT
jgi:hypothetical protein